MKECKSKLFLLIIVLIFGSKGILFSQYSSKNNYRGNWENSSTWVPRWPNPQNTLSDFNIHINGYVTVNGSLTLTGSSGNLVINDTLVVKGNLTLGDNNKLLITNVGVLIVWGDLNINRGGIAANGYFVVVNDLVKTAQFTEGAITSNQNPVKVFVGGSVPSELSGGNSNFPALDCTKQNAYTYPNSFCRYGNLNDLANTPLFDFYRSTCSFGKPTVSISGSLSFCAGGDVTLTASEGKSYLWSDGSSSQNLKVSSTGSYYVRVTDNNLCLSATSETIYVDVNSLPPKPVISPSGSLIFCAGDSVELTAGPGYKYLWSSGATTSAIKVKNTGSYSVVITNEDGCSRSSDTLIVTVNPPPAAPVISASGSLNFCSGDSVILSVGAGTEYDWSNGEEISRITIKNTGNYSVRVKNESGCWSAASGEVKVVVNPVPQVSINSGDSFCVNNTMEITGIPSGGVFNVIEGSADILNNLITSSKPGNIKIQYTYSDPCSSSIAKNIVVADLPQAKAGPDQTLTESRETTMRAKLLPSEKGEWVLISGKGEILDVHSPETKIIGLGIGENVFQWKVSRGECFSVADITVNVNELLIPSVITPNGDRENEFFYIDPDYGKVRLLVFNKWGKVEFQTDNYLNNWNGKSSRGLELPEDTYFYVLHFSNGVVKKGALLIKR